MDDNLFKWTVQAPLNTEGVIVGCTKSHEWILPWWWMNYRMHNDYPVTFFDFGDLSNAAKEWCQNKGTLVTLENPVDSFIAMKEDVAGEHSTQWELHNDLDTWKARLAWFQKPFACLHSPYKRTLWIDLDCQVRQSVAPIFDSCDNSHGISMVEEHDLILKEHRNDNLIFADETEYNSGVISFQHGIPLIQEWAKMCIEENKNHRGDQEVFSRLLYKKDMTIWPMNPTFNWRIHFSSQVPPHILHYPGVCKYMIEEQIEMLTTKAHMNLTFE